VVFAIGVEVSVGGVGVVVDVSGIVSSVGMAS